MQVIPTVIEKKEYGYQISYQENGVNKTVVATCSAPQNYVNASTGSPYWSFDSENDIIKVQEGGAVTVTPKS